MSFAPIQTAQVTPPIAAGVGRLLDFGYQAKTFSAMRSAAGTFRLIRMTVGSATNGAIYSVRGRLPGGEFFTASFLTTATTDTALRNGLIAAWNANSFLRGIAVASAASSGVAIDWTSVTPGPTGFEVEILAQPDTALGAPSVITVGALSFDALFGRYLRKTAYNDAGNVAKLVVDQLAALAGPVLTWTATHDDAGDTYDYTVLVQGPDGIPVVKHRAGVSVGANLAAFVASLATNAGLDFPTATVTSDAVAGTVTIAFPIGSQAILLNSSASNASDLVGAVVAGSAIPSVVLVYDDLSQAPTTIGGDVIGYPGDVRIGVLDSGANIAVANPGTAVSLDGIVWIETAAGVNLGRPFAAPSPSRFPHPSHRWLTAPSSAPTLAIIGA